MKAMLESQALLTITGGVHNLLKLRLWIARCGRTWFEAWHLCQAHLTNP